MHVLPQASSPQQDSIHVHSYCSLLHKELYKMTPASEVCCRNLDSAVCMLVHCKEFQQDGLNSF